MLALLQFFVLGWFAAAGSSNNNEFLASVEGGVQPRSGDEIGSSITQPDDRMAEEDLGEESNSETANGLPTTEEGLDDETNDEDMDVDQDQAKEAEPSMPEGPKPDRQRRGRQLSTYLCNYGCRRRRRYRGCYYASTCSCTNRPLNAHYTGTGPAGSNSCPWRCNGGYDQVGNSCQATTTTMTWTTTTTTTTTTTNTTTTTTTTTVTIPTLCNEHEMQCPVPSNHRRQVYSVLGSESDEACQGGGDDFPPYVRFQVGQCNTSRSVDTAKGVVVRTATLRPNLTTGSVSYQRFPTVVCSCNFPLTGGAGGAKTDSDWIDRKEGTGDFQPQLRIYRDQSFQDQVVPPESFGVEAKHMYIEVASNASDDLIELVNCSCSPSQDAQHPFAVQVLATRCPTQALPLEWLASPANAVRYSLPFFHFVDFPSVHISCQVQRCSAPETCGICGSSGRQQRLLSEEQGPASVPMAESVTIRGSAVSPSLFGRREPVPPVPVPGEQPTLAPQQRQLTVAPELKLASQSVNVPSLGETLPRSLPSESQRRVLWESVSGQLAAGAQEHHLRIYTAPANLSSLDGKALATTVENVVGQELGLDVARRLGVTAQRSLRTKSVAILSGPSTEGGSASWTVLEVRLVVAGLSATAHQHLAQRLALALGQSEGLTLQLQTALGQLGVQVAVVTAKFVGHESPSQPAPAPSPQHAEVGVSNFDIPLGLWIGIGVATFVCGCASVLVSAWQCSRKRRSGAKNESPNEEAKGVVAI